MKSFTFKSIRTRLTVSFLVLTLIPLLFVLYLTYTQQVKIIEESTFEKLVVMRDLKLNQLNKWFGEREGDVKTISQDSELIDLEGVFNSIHSQTNGFEILKRAKRVLNRYLNNYNDYSEIFIINAQTGIIELSTNENNIGKDESENLYYTQTISSRKLYIRDIHADEENENEIHMMFSIPIFGSKDTIKSQITGILVVSIDLENSLFKLLSERISLGETGEILIVNKEGFALNEFRWYENAPLKLKVTAKPVQEAIKGNTGIVITTDYRDEKILAAYAHIPKMGWGFVSKQDLKELYAPIREMLLNFILIFLIALLIIVILTISISKSISKPIVELATVAQKIGEGDFSVRTEVKTTDELGSLATEFNKMADVTASRLIIQKGVVGISEVMIGKSAIKEFSVALLKQLMKITNATMSVFYVRDETNTKFEHIASIGANKKLLKSFDAKNSEGEMSNAISKKNIYYLRAIPENTIFNYKTTAGDVTPKEIITIPVMENSTVVALISLVNVYEFTQESFAILNQSWASINSSYASLLASEKTTFLAENLVKINQELEIKSEELQVQTTEIQQTSKELKEQNVELEMQKEQLNEASRLKTTFLSNMSHELRTPLNSVIALSGVLNRRLVNQIPQEEYSYLSVIERNGKHLLSLINNILDISRIESGREEIELTKFNVNNLIGELVNMLNTQATQKNIQLIHLESDAEFMIISDVLKCRQILQNLIVNSVKFTDSGKVEVSVEKTATKMAISVVDTGIGIPKNMLSLVFDEFRQVDDSTSRRFEGTGLGLAIAKKYATLLRGEIKVKSEIGKGTEFTLILPLEYNDESDVEELSTINLKTSTKQVSAKSKSEFSKKTILLVEDNESVIIQVKDILEEIGYNILVAHNGTEGLEIMEHTIPDGIVLDLMMPGVSGFDVLETLRGVERTVHVPVLILTAKHITKKELQFLKQNNIHQLIQKGDVNKNDLLLSIFEMVFPEIEKREQLKPTLKKGTDKPVVLVVEDNPDNMISVKAMLDENYIVIEAIDGEKGVKMAKKHIPNLILMDIALPKMDGYEAFKLIREKPELKHIPIVALTASALIHDREKILTQGFDGYIPKPIDDIFFYKTIKKILYGN